MTDRSDAHTAVTPLKGKRAVIDLARTTGIGREDRGVAGETNVREGVHLRTRPASSRRCARERQSAEVGEGDGITTDLSVRRINVKAFFDQGIGSISAGLDGG